VSAADGITLVRTLYAVFVEAARTAGVGQPVGELGELRIYASGVLQAVSAGNIRRDRLLG
jgi:hypothetical protein